MNLQKRRVFAGLYFIAANMILSLSFEVRAETGAPVPDGKKVIALVPIENTQIEMPDASWHNFGEDFQASLITQMVQSEKYLVTDADLNLLGQSNSTNSQSDISSQGYIWNGSVTPAATVRFYVKALSFSTGFRGDRMFYGFDERNRTPFNDGTGRFRNEFPLRFFSWAPNWFGRSFDAKGIYPFDSQAGLDLGDGFEINALYAWLSVKYARYHSELRLDVEVQVPGMVIPYRKPISVKGDGFFFDVSGAYQNYSAGIAVARKDAMLQIVKQSIQASYQAIDHALEKLPLLAKVDAVLSDGTILLGTGPFSEVKPGVRYQSIEIPELWIEVLDSTSSGSIAKAVGGSLNLIQSGMVFKQDPSKVQIDGLLSQITPESIQLPIITLPSLPLTGLVPEVSKWIAIAKSITEGALLPYRIARYFMYDQRYHAHADLGSSVNFDAKKEGWAKQIGLSQVSNLLPSSQIPRVAILDSGVDYNHPVLHSSILFASPHRYGWDFISGDSRPYDDSYHGTQVASLVLGVMPTAQVIPVKIFNPWGITNSAAIYSAFRYAVDHGAQVIVCAWATPIRSQALELGVKYAQDHGVVVVTSAGDFGVSLEENTYYPVEYSKTYDNLISVAGVDEQDRLFKDGNKASNFGRTRVTIAAPGKNLPVAEPRSGFDRVSSSDLASAVVAGAVARVVSTGKSDRYLDWIEQVLNDSDVIPGLKNAVKEGRRLRLR